MCEFIYKRINIPGVSGEGGGAVAHASVSILRSGGGSCEFRGGMAAGDMAVEYMGLG